MIDKTLIEWYLKNRFFNDVSIEESEQVLQLPNGKRVKSYVISLHGTAGKKSKPRFEVSIEYVTSSKYVGVDFTDEFMDKIIGFLKVAIYVIDGCIIDCSKYLVKFKGYRNDLTGKHVVEAHVINRKTNKQLVTFSINGLKSINIIFMPGLSRLKSTKPLTLLVKYVVMYSIMPENFNGSNLALGIFDHIKIECANKTVPVKKFMGVVLEYNFSMFVLSVLNSIFSRDVKITGEYGVVTLDRDGFITVEGLKGFLPDYKVALTGAERIPLYELTS